MHPGGGASDRPVRCHRADLPAESARHPGGQLCRHAFSGGVDRPAITAWLETVSFRIPTRVSICRAIAHSPSQALLHSPQLAVQLGGIAGQALFAWLLLAIPVVVLLTPALTAVFRRIPALSVAESGD